MIHHLFEAKQKSRYTRITTTSQTQQFFLMSQDLLDCYVSVTALNFRYHSADNITTDRLSKNARHNIYATLYRVLNARTLVLLHFLFYNIIRFLSTQKCQKLRNQAVSKLRYSGGDNSNISQKFHIWN